MPNKNSQVTLFIILSLVLVISISLIFFLNTKSANKNQEIEKIENQNFNIVPIKSFIELCLQITAEKGVPFISFRGAHYHLPDIYYEAEPPTAYFVYQGNDISPDLKDFEKELSVYIENQLQYCIGSQEFPGFEIQYGEPQVNTKILRDNIDLTLTLSTNIVSEGFSKEINNYKSSLNGDILLRAYKASKNISIQISSDPEYICLTCLFKIADENGFKLFIDSFDENTFNIQLINENQEQEEFVFNFAADLA